MADAVEKAMEAATMGISLTPEERFEVFGDFDPDQYAEDVRERWGETDAYRESERRVASYTKADWARQKAEHSAVLERMAAAMKSGLPAEGTEAMDAAEAHREQIARWFYPCSPAMHVGLAEMYLADPRFTRTFEKIAPGLAQYLHDAILANNARPTMRAVRDRADSVDRGRTPLPKRAGGGCGDDDGHPPPHHRSVT
jgi:hypothetical protein